MSLQIYDPAWLGGLWEGEGSVYRVKRSKSGIAMKLEMNDFDTVQHAIAVAGGVGTVCLDRHTRPTAKPTHNITMRWQTYRYNDQMVLLSLILPHLFSRRVERIAELLDTDLPYNPPTLSMPWLAGYLDGEGYFAYKGTQLVYVCTTDLDTLEAVRDFVGKGNIHVRPLVQGNKQSYDWSVSGQTARTLMRELYPMMSQRRQFQIDYAMAGKVLEERPNYKTLVEAA